MLVVNVFEAKAKLSEYLELVAGGERVMICKRNKPIAELRAVEAVRSDPRPIGLGKGRFDVAPSFFEPLPEDFVDAFSEKRVAARSRVAEAPTEYGRKPAKRRTRR